MTSLSSSTGAAQQPSIEDEVLGNIRAQRIGPATVGDLNLPEPFLRRFADRILRSSFEDNFRVVVADEPVKDPATVPADGAPAPPVTTAPAATTAVPPAPAAPGKQLPRVDPLLLVIGLVLVAVVVALVIVRRRSA
jgi:hypothetical protein